MAKGKKTGGRDFKPGHSGNRRGAAAHNAEVKRIRRMTHEEVAEIGSLILDGNLEKLMEVKVDRQASVLKIWMASVVVKSINKGDAHALDVLLNRITGKVKENIELTGSRGGPIELYMSMSPAQREAKRIELETRLKKDGPIIRK